jgi:hypothetical protein
MEMYEQIREEIDALSVGQMVNMYEVHVRNLEDYNTDDKIEELRLKVSKKLGLTGGDQVVIMDGQDDQDEGDVSDERLIAVMQDPKVCLVTRDL